MKRFSTKVGDIQKRDDGRGEGKFHSNTISEKLYSSSQQLSYTQSGGSTRLYRQQTPVLEPGSVARRLRKNTRRVFSEQLGQKNRCCCVAQRQPKHKVKNEMGARIAVVCKPRLVPPERTSVLAPTRTAPTASMRSPQPRQGLPGRARGLAWALFFLCRALFAGDLDLLSPIPPYVLYSSDPRRRFPFNTAGTQTTYTQQ